MPSSGTTGRTTPWPSNPRTGSIPIPKTYIQLGDVDFTTFHERGTFHVLAEVVQGAGIVQYDFLYRPEEKVFERQVVYEAAGIDSVQRPTVFGTDYLDGYTADPPAITFGGETDASFGERHILLEEAPENVAEELTALFFYEDIAGRYDRRKELYGAGTTLGQMEDSSERQAEEGVYVREYVLHSLTTVARDGLFPEEFYGFSPQILQRDVERYGLTAFTVVKADMSMYYSEAALARGPQLGDGRYEWFFLCGQTAQDGEWKLYELYWG